MRALAFAWHCPFLYMWARALPDVHLDLLPTPYNPEGWNEAQRPLPANVHSVTEPGEADVAVAQTGADLDAFANAAYEGPTVFLSHNHFDLEGAQKHLPDQLSRYGIPLVAISEMKAKSWREAGYREHVSVVYPYVEREWFLPRAKRADAGPVLTVCNALRRPLFDLAWWKRRASLSFGLRPGFRLIGSGNDGLPGATGPAASWDDLRLAYAHAGLYLNPTCEPFEDAWNLSTLEAHAAGAEVVSRQKDAWRRLVDEHDPFDPFDRERFRRGWLAVLEGAAGAA